MTSGPPGSKSSSLKKNDTQPRIFLAYSPQAQTVESKKGFRPRNTAPRVVNATEKSLARHTIEDFSRGGHSPKPVVRRRRGSRERSN
jgi:hypothetical protein